MFLVIHFCDVSFFLLEWFHGRIVINSQNEEFDPLGMGGKHEYIF